MNTPLDESNHPWQPVAPAGPQPGALRYLWNHPIVIAGVMGLLLLLVTAVSIIAIKAVGNDAAAGGPGTGNGPQDTGNQQPGPVASGTTGAGSPPAGQPTGTPAAGGTAPAVNSTNVVYLSGKLTLPYYNAGVDLDTAKTSGLAEGEKYDFDVTETGLTGVNRGQAGVGAAAGAPTPAGCTAAPVTWGTSAHISVLTVGATICVRTGEDRLGALTVTKLDRSDDGQLQILEVDYVVWKKQGDL